MINLYDRIKERTYTIGTGNFALSGVVQGFSSFSSVYSNSGELFYAVTDGTNYEIGSGVYLSLNNQIQRFPIKSTNSNNLVNFSEGLKEIYVTYPATNAVFNTSGLFPIPQNSGLTFWSSSNSLSSSNKIVVDSGNGRLGINKNNPTSSIDVGGPSSLSNIRASGFIVGNSGVIFPSGNNGLSSYIGGAQLTHFEMNKTDAHSAALIELSGSVNQNILLKKQNAGFVFAGPPSGCSPPCYPAYPIFRPLTAEDIPIELNLYSSFRISTSPTDPLAEGESSTIYLHPYDGNTISLFDGSKWIAKKFDSTLVLNASSISPNINYDLFAYLNNGNLAFEYAIGGDGELISLQDGIYCKTINKTRRYLGSVRKEGSLFKNNYNTRFVFNAYNRVKRLNAILPSDVSWSITPSFDFTVIESIPPIKFLYGLPEFIDAHINLLVELPGGARSSYQLILFNKAYTNIAIANGNILSDIEQIFYNIDENFIPLSVPPYITAIGQGFYLDGSYTDQIKTVATASMTTKFAGHLELSAAERVPIGVSPTISYNGYIGAVGYNAISYQ